MSYKYPEKYFKYKKKYMDFKQENSLHVRDPWLFYIQTGKKTVEGRRGNKNKYNHWLGQKVYFFNNDRKIPVKVVEVRHYQDLYQYLIKEGHEKVLPGIVNFEEAVKIYHQFYSDDDIKNAGGMLAIEIELI